MFSCSFNSTDKISDLNKQFSREKEIVLANYRPLIGTYTGEIEFASSNRSRGYKTDTILVVSVLYEDNGKDATGQPLPRPVLNVTLWRDDMPSREFFYSGRFDKALGQFIFTLTNVAAPNTAMSGNDPKSMVGDILNGILNAKVTHQNGLNGNLKVKLVSSETNYQISRIEFFERVLNQYKKITGVYEGRAIPNSALTGLGLKPFKFQIAIRAYLEGPERPVLRATLIRDADPSLGMMQEMDVQYQRDSFPEKIYLRNILGETNSYFFNFQGQFISGQVDENTAVAEPARIQGSVQTLRAFTGTADLVKIKDL